MFYVICISLFQTNEKCLQTMCHSTIRQITLCDLVIILNLKCHDFGRCVVCSRDKFGKTNSKLIVHKNELSICYLIWHIYLSSCLHCIFRYIQTSKMYLSVKLFYRFQINVFLTIF